MGLFDRFRRKKVEEVTPGGSPIYRYEKKEGEGLRIPQQSGRYLEEIQTHFEQLFPGRKSFIYHEIISDLVHIDLHIMEPTQDMPFYVVYTTGMSDRPMHIPSEVPQAERRDLELAELYLFLPGEWDLGGEGRSPMDLDGAHIWPLQIMRFIARFPHEYDTWLAWGHSIPNGEGYAPLHESTKMGGVILNYGDGPLGKLQAGDGRLVRFYQMVPCYKEEIEYKLKYGMDELMKLFRENNVPHVLDPQRPNLCPDFHEILDG